MFGLANVSHAQVDSSDDELVLSLTLYSTGFTLRFQLTEEILEAIQTDIQRVLQDQDRSCYRPVCEACGTRLVWEETSAPALSAPGFWIHPIPDLNAHTPRPIWAWEYEGADVQLRSSVRYPGPNAPGPICRSCRGMLAWQVSSTIDQRLGLWVHADGSDTHAPMPVWGVSRSLL
jgi:hypothetical protein